LILINYEKIISEFLIELLYVYDCRWNYRPDHCMYGSNCKTAENLGAAILHGCRRVFQNDRELAFAHVYKAFQKVFFFYLYNSIINKNVFSLIGKVNLSKSCLNWYEKA
jgi:hypothetical protein